MESTKQDFTFDQTQIAAKQARDRFWKILLPVILASLLVIALLVYLIMASHGDGVLLEQLGGVASVIIILPALLGLLITLAVIVGLVFLVAKLTGALPDLAQKIINLFSQVKTETQKITDGAADPFIKIREISAKAHQILGSLQKRLK